MVKVDRLVAFMVVMKDLARAAVVENKVILGTGVLKLFIRYSIRS